MKKSDRTAEKNKKKKVKTVYYEDKGQTLYSMAALDGKTPEEREEFEKRRRETPAFSGREKGAMIRAAFTVYGPLLLIVVLGFGIAALLMYLLLL